MQYKNNTPFVLTCLPTRVAETGRTMTIIVKGTFDLTPDAACTPAKDQLPIKGDETYLDDIGRSLAWASDLAPFKPHTDFYIIGSYHQPNGIAARRGDASFTLGPLHKELVFWGPRLALQRPDKTWVVTEPEPFVTLPLRWEYSFGGLQDRRNPMGMGIDHQETPDGAKVVPLPRIEHPQHLVTTMKDRPSPANFAPLPPTFLARRRKLGTRDRRWAVFRAPLPPKDYDPSYHNAAPEDQQAGNYPLGNETLLLRNLHPRYAILTTRLPAVRPVVGLLRQQDDGITAEEVAMHLDTVVAMPDADRLVLLWRGVTGMRGKIPPDEFTLCQLELEACNAPPASPSLKERMLADHLAAETQKGEAEQAEIDQVLAGIRELLQKANLPPDVMKIVQTESDPKIVHDALDRYLTGVIDGLKQKYPHVAARFPKL